jgi:hypothetical protein
LPLRGKEDSLIPTFNLLLLFDTDVTIASLPWSSRVIEVEPTEHTDTMYALPFNIHLPICLYEGLIMEFMILTIKQNITTLQHRSEDCPSR